MIKPEIILALDIENLSQVKFFLKRTHPFIKIFKVGIVLFTRYGPKVVKLIQDFGAEVFLDLKFFDIPNTVEKAVKSAVSLRPKMLTLHIQGGDKMLMRAKKISIEESQRLKINPPLLLGVTVLTSQYASPLRVLKLAKEAKNCHLDGVVCSVHELKLLKRNIKDKDFVYVTPGVRIENLKEDDQKRTATLREAKELGADYVVLGRPILEAEDIESVLEKIRSQLK